MSPQKVVTKHLENMASTRSVTRSSHSDHVVDSKSPHDSESEEEGQQLLWSSVRHKMREPFSEFFGTFIMLLFGDGVVAQVCIPLTRAGALH